MPTDQITDADLVRFLQWALPRMGLRWEGFRKPRGQVKKRISGRLEELGLGRLAAYRERLEAEPAEWAVLDHLCRVTISRFHRHRRAFRRLGRRVLPEVAARARDEGRGVRAWSAGCASGEEPYTVAILWRRPAESFPEVTLSVLATDVDLHLLLHRARRACYPEGSLKELPDEDVEAAFGAADDEGARCLRAEFRHGVRFAAHDVRAAPPRGPFDVVLCRNLAFTYFAEGVQRAVLEALRGVLRSDGWLVIGSHEELPEETGWAAMDGVPSLLRRVE